MPDNATPERNFEEEIAVAIFDLHNYPPAGQAYSKEGLMEHHSAVFELAKEAIDAAAFTAVRGIAIQVEATQAARTTASRNKDQGSAISLGKRAKQYQALLKSLENKSEAPHEPPKQPTDTSKKKMSGAKTAAV